MAVVCFGDYELNPAVPELRRRGRPVHLQEMPLRALEILLERPNELVARDAFFARLWPEDSSGMLDDNLNTAVRKLRLALDDSAHHPRYIETVAKRGYRFVAPVTRGDDRPDAVTADMTVKPAPPSATGRRRALIGIGAALAGVVIFGSAFVLGVRGERSPEYQAPRAAGEFRSLVVLPFANASGSEADKYFSDGLADELMNGLSRFKDLEVVSRTSAFALEGTDLDAREIGRLLDADALVEGSVRRDGDRLRISIRLVNARNGYQLWSAAYDRQAADVFAVQEDIARAVANTLTGELLGPSQRAALAVTVTDPVAYDQYLQGRFYWHRRTEQGLRAAAGYFESATRHAPDYAPAWAGLADAWAVLGFYDYLSPEEAFPRAKEAARRALELDAENSSACATLGYAALYYDWNLPEAEAYFLRSIALRPDDSKAHQWYANLLTAAGRFDEADREMRRAQQLDPLSLIANAALGWVRYHAGNYEEALGQYRLTLKLDADFELAYLWSGWALEALGRYDESLEMLREAVKRSGGSGISSASLARVHALRGEREDAERILSGLTQSEQYVPSYEIAKAWFALGKTELAHDWLRRAFEQRSHSLVFLRVDPQLSTVRNDAGFLQVVGRLQPIAKDPR